MIEAPLVLCDTSILVEFFERKNAAVEAAIAGVGKDNVVINFIVSAELIRGARNREHFSKIKKLTNNLLVADFNNDIAQITSNLLDTYFLSHNLEIPDAMIAATCLYYSLPLYTLNKKDFEYIENLELHRA